MNRSHWVSEKITPTHIAKLAYIYIRQSTMGQVTKHRESTELQYRLSQRAESLGWTADAIKIIDDDLGRSGSSSAERPGFQQLITEIGLGRVGMVLSYDASRLARNNKDWYQLLELCSLFDALIGDSERIYDPSLYHDRLLLGLSGIMSEAELHHLRRRLLAGKRLKAERGELRQRLPVGLVRLPSGEVIQHPHEDVRSRLMLVFDKFDELRSANAVARYFKKARLLIPVRPAYDHDSTAHEWREPDRQRVLYILHNPAYAGAYAYGRKTPEPTADNGPQWQVLIHDHYPGYITWATFLANQEQLKANLANFLSSCSGVARQGASLLQGIIICHHCGLHMRTEYKGIRREPTYICSRPGLDAGTASCQMVWGKLLDAEVEKLVLSALAPDQIAIALAAHEKQEQEAAALARQWELRIERMRYETDRVHRQYDQVEPENRLVARSLETAWEEKLHQLEKVEREYAAWQHQQMTVKSIDRRELMALAENFPALWRSASNKDKKEIIRLLVAHVIVEQDREQGKVWFQINWQTGAISQHWYIRIVGNYDSHAYKDALQKRLHELAADHLTAPEIARVLNDEEYETAHRKRFTPEIVNQLRYKWGIPSLFRHTKPPDRWPDGSYSVNGAAKLLGISAGCLRKRIEKGHLRATQRRKGASLHVFLSPEEIAQHKN